MQSHGGQLEMLTLLKYLFEKLDFAPIVEMLRQRNNREMAAQLHLVFVKACEILDLHKAILSDLNEAIQSHKRSDDAHTFKINPHRMIWLLQRQAANFEDMDFLVGKLTHALRILDPVLWRLYRDIEPGKAGILFDAQLILSNGRLPAVEQSVRELCVDENRKYRTLWFGEISPEENRQEMEKYLHGDDGRKKYVIDVNVRDGDRFFTELDRYFVSYEPLRRLQELDNHIENYRRILIDNFSVSDLLSDIRRVGRNF
jgi:hypothetical protein